MAPLLLDVYGRTVQYMYVSLIYFSVYYTADVMTYKLKPPKYQLSLNRHSWSVDTMKP